MLLYVDDKREAPEGWRLARSIRDAVSALNTGYVEVLSLDHDIEYPAGWPMDKREDFTVVLQYAILLPENMRPKHFYCHSGNGEAYSKYPSLLNAAGLALETLHDYSKDL